MKYRAEIDGLRALAVVPVIFFHAGFELFSGGFVGVDVFFVISGYLITTILIEDIENKRFSILNFYERRARRILPALFFVMLVCIPFAWTWMLPSQMKDFSHSLVAVSLFASNILFWKETDYFATAAEEKPLLHTWSLAVEEQYYVLFPFFLIFAWRFGKSKVIWTIIVLATISLLLSEWGWRNKATENFYLAPTRAWELFAGSISAFIVQKKGVTTNNPLAMLGLAAIVFSIFFYDKNTPFPSLYALVPVLGAVFLIVYAGKATICAKLLSAKPVVGIGLISYSAYLWHQPIFAYADILWLEFEGYLKIGIVLVTFPIAFFSHRYIEKPFREVNNFSRNAIFSFSAIGIVSLSLIGVIGHFTNGFENRRNWTQHYYYTFAQKELFNSACIENFSFLQKFSSCRMSNELPPTIALIGDSHSHALYESLAASYEDQTIINIGQWSCLPFVNSYHLMRDDCNNYQEITQSFLESNQQIHTVIFTGYWGYLASGGWNINENGFRIHKNITDSDKDEFISNATYFINNIPKHVKNVILVEDVPDLDYPPARCADLGVLRNIRSNCHMKYDKFEAREKSVGNLLDRVMAISERINYVDTVHLFCNQVQCNSMSVNGTLYSDSDHVSRLGANLITQQILNLKK